MLYVHEDLAWSAKSCLAVFHLGGRTSKPRNGEAVTPDQLVHDAVKQLIAQFQSEDHVSLLRQARGMWKDRTDLPSLADLRREWDRQTEPDNGDTTAD